MALTTGEQLRLFINDRPRSLTEIKFGDGTANIFQLSGIPIVTGSTGLGTIQPSAYVSITTAWSATASATFDLLNGQATLVTTPSANSALQFRYSYATFSDQEIDLVTAQYAGDINRMRLALIDNLMGDAYKRANWQGAAGGGYSESHVMANLMEMRSAVWREMTIEQGPVIVVDSWDASQEQVG